MNAKTAAASLLFGLLAVGVWAADDAATQLQNLVYYPHAGNFRVTGQFTGSLQDSGSTDNDLGVQTTSRGTIYTRADVSGTVGLGGGLRLAATETRLFGQTTQSTTNGVTTDSTSRGFSDPTISVSERIHDSEDDGFYADAAGSFVPRLGRALAAGNGQEGNDLASAWSATASIPVYYRYHEFDFANEVELAPTLTRAFGGVTSGTTLKSSTLNSSYWSSAIVIADRFHLSDSWYIQPGVSLNIPYTYRSANQSAGAADSYDKVNFAANPDIHVGFLPTPWLLIDASATYSDQGTSAYPATGSSTSAQTAQTYGAILVSAAF